MERRAAHQRRASDGEPARLRRRRLAVRAARGEERAGAHEEHARQLRDVAASVSGFVGGRGSVDGAQLPNAADEAVSLDADRFLAALTGALNGTAGKAAGGGDADEEGGDDELDDDMMDDDDDELDDDDDDDDRGDSGMGDDGDGEGLAELMAAMDRELRDRQVAPDFELAEEPAEPVSVACEALSSRTSSSK